jgi:zinc protease
MDVNAEKGPQATAAGLDLLESLKANPIDDDRIERAKTLLRSAHIRQTQKAEDIAGAMGDDYMATADPHFSDLYLQRIDQLKASDLQAVARKYFDRATLMTTALFPTEFAGAAGMPKIEDVLRSAATTQAVAHSSGSETSVQRYVLDDGTIVLAKRIPTSPIVVMDMYSLGGLTAEDAQTNGLGNLAMELLMRGTKTRSAEQIAEFFDSTGGSMGTTCGNNTWAWNASCLTRDFDKTFAAYADVVNNPTFAEDQTREIKRRIKAAIDAEDADWFAQAARFFKKEFFGPSGSPYQFLPIGTKENLEKFTSEQARAWYEQKIQTAPRVLAVFGNVDPEHVKQIAGDLLGKGNKHAAPSHPSLPKIETAPMAGTSVISVVDVKVQKTEQQLAGVIIGFKSESVVGDPANYVLDVINTLTGGFTYPTGYIFETLRGLGLVYVAGDHNVPGRDAKLPGTFEAYAGCGPENVNKVVELTLQNIARVEGSEKDVDMDWFKRAKELMIVADAMENETPAAQAQMAAVDEVLGLGYDYHRQFADHVRAVTLPQVQEVARHRLTECIVTISTPRPDLVQVKPGTRTYTSFPPVDLAPKGVQHDVGGGGK